MFLIKYALFLIPLCFFWLSIRNKEKFNKLKSTGRIPDLEAANRNVTIFSILGVISLVGIIYILFGHAAE